jgi:hypothetical protein
MWLLKVVNWNNILHFVICLITVPQIFPSIVLRTMLSSRYLKVMQLLLTSSYSYSRHFVYPFFYFYVNNVYSKTVAMQDVATGDSPSLLYAGYSFPPWLYVILSHFSHDRSNWSPTFFSTTFHKFSGISDLPSEVSTFQEHAMLCSKCSTLLASSSKNLYIL